MTKKHFSIYTDGSWSKKSRKVGSGIDIYDPSGEQLFTIAATSHKNTNGKGLTGEINAVKMALSYIWVLPRTTLKKHPHIIIYHDFAELDPSLGHKVKNPLMQEYHAWLNRFQKTFPNLTIEFEKVKAHKGNQKNNKVDKLARQATNL